jgi:D-aminopeptidase
MDAGKTLREHGLRIGELEPGPTTSIADVPGVAVGHVTVGCTGVTAVLPGPVEGLWAEPVPAGVAVLNGAGELTGFLQISEWGVIETPVYLTATMSVGRVYDGAVAVAMAAEPRVGVEAVVIPVVGECDDSWLNDPRAAQVEAEQVQRALADASGSQAVEQGAVGAGTGMVCFGWKGGIGSSSRATAAGHTVGVLVLANYGDSSDLRIDGVPVGRELAAPPSFGRDPAGSCIAVVATDAPLGPAQLSRVARRAGLGLARTGSVAHHGSGEIFVAFSTTTRTPRGEPGPPALPDAELDPLFHATVDTTEEAVVNALWAAETTSGRDGRVCERLPHEPVLELLARHGRLGG